MVGPNAVSPSLAPMRALVSRVLPGKSRRIHDLHQQILDFACNPNAKSVLLQGPIGCGKSTIARLIGLLKRVAPLNTEEATRMVVTDVKFDGANRIDERYISDWYVELALTGLVETLADLQLFGATKGAYTGGGEGRAGLFEQAMTGRVPHGEIPVGAQLTGGIVFLDEVGDLSPTLQAKLLPVLSEGTFYRLGGEGHKGLRFRGVTITASWKTLGPTILRPDLLSRIAPYVIEVPGLSGRLEDFEEVFVDIENNLLESAKTEILRILKADTNVDRPYWTGRREALRPTGPTARHLLASVDWSRYGEMRGLAAALQRILLSDQDPHHVISSLARIDLTSPDSAIGPDTTLIARLLARDKGGGGLADYLRELESEDQLALKQRLHVDSDARRKISQKLGITAAKLDTQIKDLGRRRVTKAK